MNQSGWSDDGSWDGGLSKSGKMAASQVKDVVGDLMEASLAKFVGVVG